ncbi:MAG: rRNA maturation RNase YbeY [Ruminococcaceae bacterium]|nr:rRNA maturation RNase YbeY [Oscillospiraceae bacterium]
MDKVKVNIDDQQNEVKIPTGTRLLLRRCCNAVLEMEGFTDRAEVNIYFVDSETIRSRNAQFRGKDAVTDVLSFPLGENREFDVNPETGARMLGDVLICVSKAAEQAATFGHSFRREMAYLTTHSMLHIFGYDHEAGGLESVRMREKEETIMVQLGLPRNGSYVPDTDSEV